MFIMHVLLMILYLVLIIYACCLFTNAIEHLGNKLNLNKLKLLFKGEISKDFNYLSGSKYEKRSGFCIEPQFYPNAINTPEFVKFSTSKSFNK